MVSVLELRTFHPTLNCLHGRPLRPRTVRQFSYPYSVAPRPRNNTTDIEAVKEAALDARLHHAVGPFGPFEWWIEPWPAECVECYRFWHLRFVLNGLKERFHELVNETQDHGLYRWARGVTLLLSSGRACSRFLHRTFLRNFSIPNEATISQADTGLINVFRNSSAARTLVDHMSLLPNFTAEVNRTICTGRAGQCVPA